MTQLQRTITHWTGGGSRANETDKRHYHFLTEWDGKVVAGKHEPEDNIVTSDGEYAAHVLNLNKGSIGCAMAGMKDAVEEPYDPGAAPITEKQFEAHCLALAEIHRKYAIPVTRKTCLTHAEVEPTLGVKQNGKWDLTRLPFKKDLRGALAVGDYMRERVQSYAQAAGGNILPKANAALLREGMQGEEVKQLQRDLAALGYHLGEIDGRFGPRTKSAVKAFQDAHGLEPDGVAGPQTQSAILTKGTPPPPRPEDEKTLKAKGSTTIINADKGIIAGVGAAGAAVVPPVLGTVNEAVQQAQGFLPTAHALLRDHWQLILVGVALWFVWRAFQQIKAARVAAAVNGENLSK